MCGICGYITKKPFSESDLSVMRDALSHRGPDAAGQQILYNDSAQIGLAHRRLKVLDLSTTGNQPMCSPDRRVWIIYNGEVYNYRQLHRLLRQRQYSFKGTSDTEVLLNAYLEWGVKCFEKFLGMFALCIYDQRTEKLIIARDRAGIKPLYYFQNDRNHFVFASELKSLIQFPDFSRSIDVDSIYQYLSFQYIPTPQSIYQDLLKLDPGSYLQIDTRSYKTDLATYWSPVRAHKVLMRKTIPSFSQYLTTLESELLNSIEEHMNSDVPLGAFLSGGIDSSLVVALMSRRASTRVKTFTIGFNEDHRNEAHYASRIAEYLGTEHHTKYLRAEDVFETIDKLPLIFDEPFADNSALPTYLLSQFAQGRVTVALSGDGGDEVFGGYNRYMRTKRAVALGSFLPFRIRKQIMRVLEKVPHDILRRISAAMQYESPLDIFHHLVAMWKGKEHSLLIGKEYDFSKTRFRQIFELTNDCELIRRLMLVDFSTYLPDDGLVKVDRASSANALEVRVPLLDPRVVELAMSLPIRNHIKNGVGKHALRAILEQYIPRSEFERPKMGFRLPMNTWLRGPLKYLIDKYLASSRLKKRGLLDPERVHQAVDMHMSRRYNYFFMLWPVIVLEMWFETWMPDFEAE